MQNFSSVRQPRTCFALLAGLLFAIRLPAQTVPDSYPVQGLLPSGSYTVDKLENIDKATGNMVYHIPLATLPKVGPDDPFHLQLIYNCSGLRT